MTEAIESAITQIAAVVGAVSGIVQAPTFPFETQNVAPFAVTYFLDGRIDAGPIGTKKNLINIRVDVLMPKNDLDRDLAVLTPLVDTVSMALVREVSDTGQRFGNTISTFESLRIVYLSDTDYAGVPMRGYGFTMENTKLLISL